MKCVKALLVAALVLSGSSVASAQASYIDKAGNEYTFKKHVFLDLHGGAQYTVGESTFGKLVSPNVQLGIGYQFNPWFGARLAANAWLSRGGYNGLTETGKIVPAYVNYKWKYVAPGIDFIFNLSNALFGWNPNRVFNLSAFVGGRANIAFDNDEANALAKAYEMRYNWDGTKVLPVGRGGLDFNFRVSNSASIMVEGNVNLLSDKYNSKKAGNPDWYFNAVAGLRINLGKSYTKKTKEPVPSPEPQQQEYVEPTPTPAPAHIKVEPIRRDVFFTIGKYYFVAAEQSKVDDIVAYMNEHPEAKVTVTGYADAGTGTVIINDRLAAKRAAFVVKALKNKGIAEGRISYDSKGSRVQPFAENDKNRVTILVAEP